MKRTLFSCCILLTALAVPLLPARNLRAESDCDTTSDSLEGVGHCACPYIYADTYGECFWEEDDCDRAADESGCGQVAETESVTISDDIEPYNEEKTDYWYDGESGSYYYYEFSDDEAIVEQTVEPLSDPLDELFDMCETETVDAPSEVADEVAAEDVVAEDVVAEEMGTYAYEDEYGYDDYGYDSYNDYSYDDEGEEDGSIAT